MGKDNEKNMVLDVVFLLDITGTADFHVPSN